MRDLPFKYLGHSGKLDAPRFAARPTNDRALERQGRMEHMHGSASSEGAIMRTPGTMRPYAISNAVVRRAIVAHEPCAIEAKLPHWYSQGHY